MLSDLQLHKLPQLFAAYDADGDGVIQLRDFQQLLDQFAAFRDWKPGSPQYQQLQDRLHSRWKHMQTFADEDDDGRVTLTEWLAYIEAVLHDPDAFEVELAGVAGAVFGVFDVDGDGAISSEELRALYRGLGLGLGNAEAMWQRLDMEPGERMTKERFLDLFEDFLTSPDAEAPGNWLFGG